MTVKNETKKRFIDYLLDVIVFRSGSRVDEILVDILNSGKLEKIHFVRSFEGIDPKANRLIITQQGEDYNTCEFFMDCEEGDELKRFKEIFNVQLQEYSFAPLYILMHFNESTQEYMDKNFNEVFTLVSISKEELENTINEFEKMNKRNMIINKIDEALDKKSKRNFNKWVKELKGLESNGL